jgi:hypothetical protein
MCRLVIGFSTLLLVGLLATHSAADDQFVGAIWQMKLKNLNGMWVDAVKFRATKDGKVLFDAKPIGTHTSKSASEITMTWNKKGPLLDGRYELMRVKKDGAWWAGTLTRASDGKEIPIRLSLIKD